MIVVNLKNYITGSTSALVKLVEACGRVGRESGVRIVVAPGACDLVEVVGRVGVLENVSVWAQHVDGVGMGATTGWLCPEAIKNRGVAGTILNHSEHKLLDDELRKTVEECKRVELAICVCVDGWEEAVKAGELGVNFVAYEPPELVGSRERSVSQEKPLEIARIVEGLPGAEVLVGAGVHERRDVKVALGLGAKGILVATDVVRAPDPYRELIDLARAF